MGCRSLLVAGENFVKECLTAASVGDRLRDALQVCQGCRPIGPAANWPTAELWCCRVVATMTGPRCAVVEQQRLNGASKAAQAGGVDCRLVSAGCPRYGQHNGSSDQPGSECSKAG